MPETIEHNRKAPQNIPELFMEIMRNDDILAHLLSLPAVPFEDTIEIIARKRSLIKDAERMLAWNANKGNNVA